VVERAAQREPVDVVVAGGGGGDVTGDVTAQPVLGALGVEVDGADEDGRRAAVEGGEVSPAARVVARSAAAHQRLQSACAPASRFNELE